MWGKGWSWSSLSRRLGLAAGASLLLLLLSPSPALAQAATQADGREADARVTIAIDATYKLVKTGDKILYTTTVTNTGAVASRSLVVAMNIINLNAAGDIVDPEDWSPQRTQYIDTIPAGQSKTLNWRVNAILDGNYLVYMVLVPEPGGKEATSIPVARGIPPGMARLRTATSPGAIPIGDP